MPFNWLEWMGYAASLIVLISLLMSSIIKLRFLNLFGSCVFSIYGFLIGALPVGIMNLAIVLINVYYLMRIYHSKEYFKLMSIDGTDPYVKGFLEFYSEEIQKYTAFHNTGSWDISFLILRNMVPAGIFLASAYDAQTLKIDLDFVIPEYRDFKTGAFIYGKQRNHFLERGYSRFICTASNPKYVQYLKRMGFTEVTEEKHSYYSKSIG